jgi:hypothetical protein
VKQPPVTCGSGLVRDGIDAVYLNNRADAIASKPAPAKECGVQGFSAFFG